MAEVNTNVQGTGNTAQQQEKTFTQEERGLRRSGEENFLQPDSGE